MVRMKPLVFQVVHYVRAQHASLHDRHGIRRDAHFAFLLDGGRLPHPACHHRRELVTDDEGGIEKVRRVPVMNHLLIS
jgi:hypothetical protein